MSEIKWDYRRYFGQTFKMSLLSKNKQNRNKDQFAKSRTRLSDWTELNWTKEKSVFWVNLYCKKCAKCFCLPHFVGNHWFKVLENFQKI